MLVENSPVSEISVEQLFAKLCEVEQLLKSQKEQKGIWNIQDIADYCGMSYRHVYGNIVSDPRFPAAVDLPSRTGGKCKPVFVRDEVIRYFVQNKKKKHRV